MKLAQPFLSELVPNVDDLEVSDILLYGSKELYEELR